MKPHMIKKEKIQNDDPRLSIRLDKEVKNRLTLLRNKENMTISQIIRKIIDEYLEREDQGGFKHEVVSLRERGDHFIKLAVWIYKKRKDTSCKESLGELNYYMSAIKKMEGFVPREIMEEFDKVLADIFRVKTETGIFFRFSDSSDKSKAFNYPLFEHYILTQNIL